MLIFHPNYFILLLVSLISDFESQHNNFAQTNWLPPLCQKLRGVKSWQWASGEIKHFCLPNTALS